MPEFSCLCSSWMFRVGGWSVWMRRQWRQQECLVHMDLCLSSSGDTNPWELVWVSHCKAPLKRRSLLCNTRRCHSWCGLNSNPAGLFLPPCSFEDKRPVSEGSLGQNVSSDKWKPKSQLTFSGSCTTSGQSSGRGRRFLRSWFYFLVFIVSFSWFGLAAMLSLKMVQPSASAQSGLFLAFSSERQLSISGCKERPKVALRGFSVSSVCRTRQWNPLYFRWSFETRGTWSKRWNWIRTASILLWSTQRLQLKCEAFITPEWAHRLFVPWWVKIIMTVNV